MPKLDVIYRSCKGELYKILFKLGILKIKKHPLGNRNDTCKKLIVSLTSYGRRVKSVAPYAIMSMMRQSYKPDMIILWLDNDHWNYDNLPKRIKKLITKGLTVKFCADLKSYKKLIPTLQDYPDDLIFTIDDDVYYPSDILNHIMSEYNRNPEQIIGTRGYRISFDKKHETLLPYNKWETLYTANVGKNVFLTGSGGCLYSRHLLHDDITNIKLFESLAPKADDIWFYFMAYLKGTNINILSISVRDTISIDSFYQHFHQGSNLCGVNCGENLNDIQLRNVMDYYGIQDSDLYDKSN